MLWSTMGWNRLGPHCAWFEADSAAVRCAYFPLAEQPDDLSCLLELATMAIGDADGIVRVGELRFFQNVREVSGTDIAQRSRELLRNCKAIKIIVLLPLP